MNKLEYILKSYNRPVSVLEVRYAPQVIRLRLDPIRVITATGKPGLKTKLSHLRSLADDVAAALGVANVTFTRDKEGIWAEVPRDKVETVYAHDCKYTSEKAGLPVVLGKSTSDRWQVVDLSQSHSPHILIGGTTGSGKSQMLHAIVYSLVTRVSPTELQLILIDSNATQKAHHIPSIKTDGLGIWRGGPHVATIETDAPGALKALQMLVAKKNARYINCLLYTSPSPRDRS